MQCLLLLDRALWEETYPYGPAGTVTVQFHDSSPTARTKASHQASYNSPATARTKASHLASYNSPATARTKASHQVSYNSPAAAQTKAFNLASYIQLITNCTE